MSWGGWVLRARRRRRLGLPGEALAGGRPPAGRVHACGQASKREAGAAALTQAAQRLQAGVAQRRLLGRGLHVRQPLRLPPPRAGQQGAVGGQRPGAGAGQPGCRGRQAARRRRPGRDGGGRIRRRGGGGQSQTVRAVRGPLLLPHRREEAGQHGSRSLRAPAPQQPQQPQRTGSRKLRSAGAKQRLASDHVNQSRPAERQAANKRWCDEAAAVGGRRRSGGSVQHGSTATQLPSNNSSQ